MQGYRKKNIKMLVSKCFMEPCLSGLRYLFAKEAGALKPLDGSNPSGSAIFQMLYYLYGNRRAEKRKRRAEGDAVRGFLMNA